jgi:hypothetical protein
MASSSPVRVAGLGYSLSWLVGLSVFSSSTDVHSGGREIQSAFAGHGAAITAQYVFTEGLPAVCLGVVVVALARSVVADPRARTRLLVSGLMAAIISVIQCVLGIVLITQLVPSDRIDAIGRVSDLIDRLDGVKMLLLAVVGLTAGLAIWRERLHLPRWLGYVAFALSAAITVSGIGYLFLVAGPAYAAWVSLPLLLVFVTGSALTLSS